MNASFTMSDESVVSIEDNANDGITITFRKTVSHSDSDDEYVYNKRGERAIWKTVIMRLDNDESVKQLLRAINFCRKEI